HRLLALLRQSAAFQARMATPIVQRGFSYVNYYYIATILLSGYLGETALLGDDRSALHQQLDAEFSAARESSGATLVEIADNYLPDDDKRRKFALAFEFGERFADLALLARLCHACSWPERS